MLYEGYCYKIDATTGVLTDATFVGVEIDYHSGSSTYLSIVKDALSGLASKGFRAGALFPKANLEVAPVVLDETSPSEGKMYVIYHLPVIWGLRVDGSQVGSRFTPWDHIDYYDNGFSISTASGEVTHVGLPTGVSSVLLARFDFGGAVLQPGVSFSGTLFVSATSVTSPVTNYFFLGGMAQTVSVSNMSAEMRWDAPFTVVSFGMNFNLGSSTIFYSPYSTPTSAPFQVDITNDVAEVVLESVLKAMRGRFSVR